MKKGYILTIGSIVSAILLITLGLLQMNDSKILQLPSQWLAIIILPVLIALLVGGFITRFKGFGVELESSLKTPVATLNLTASDAVADILGDEKQSMNYLSGLSVDKKSETRWLMFRSGKKNFYTLNGVIGYMHEFPNLEYLEIKSEAGEIICLLPTSVFGNSVQLHRGDVNRENLKRFIKAIENDNVPEEFPDTAITLKISSENDLVNVLKQLRNEKADFAAVVSPKGKYLGVIFANEVERKIADSVLTAKTT